MDFEHRRAVLDATANPPVHMTLVIDMRRKPEFTQGRSIIMEQQQVGGEILKPGPLLLQGTITDAHHGDPKVLHIEVDAGRRAPKASPPP